jgi:hypothetical protein
MSMSAREVMLDSKDNTCEKEISDLTRLAVREFVEAAVLRLSEVLKNKEPQWQETEVKWERGPDGHFRERTTRKLRLWPTLSDEWLRSLSGFDNCAQALKSDAVVGPHLDRLVGSQTGTSRLDVETILRSFIYAMLNNHGGLAFTDEQFNRKWRDLSQYLCTDLIAFKTVALFPNLVLPEFPVALTEELVLDQLSEDEVTRCCEVGILRPLSRQFPLINGEYAIGIRRTIFLPKLIRSGGEPLESLETASEGSFGSRPWLRDDLVVDDVLSALRLFKHTQLATAGRASWTDSFSWFGTSFRVMGQWPYGGRCELSKGELLEFLELWRLLAQGAKRFDFSIRRFNLAFDRGLLTDRIVDLIIAAESLLLGELDVQYRGELRFRFALRAAKFIEHPSYNEHDVFRVMLRAYDSRSAIVHGGSPKDTRLPDNPSANLPRFTDAIEELVRLALRKALSMKERGKKLRQSEYWEDLLFKSDADVLTLAATQSREQ